MYQLNLVVLQIVSLLNGKIVTLKIIFFYGKFRCVGSVYSD